MTTFTTQDRQDNQRTPLTVERIRLLANEYLFINKNCGEIEGYYQLARAIEKAHGVE